jgi:hypothetical protein
MLFRLRLSGVLNDAFTVTPASILAEQHRKKAEPGSGKK